MKKFFRYSALFLLPLVAIVLLVVLVDPFNYYRESSIVSNEVKHNTSFKFHYPLWKSIEFKRHPYENILVGDSRTDALGVQLIDSLTGEKWYNFSYGGASMPEIIETFWYATKYTQLKRVYLGLNFNLFNGYKIMNRVNEARDIINQPLLYPFNKTVMKAFLYNVYYGVTGGDPQIGVPTMDPETFWNFQLTKSAENYYGAYKLSQDFIKGLRDIASHCKTYNIELRFFIPPTHTDLQKRIDDFGLRKQEEWWKKELSTIAPVVDMDIPDEYTSNRANFKDPYHTKDPSIVVKRLIGSVNEK